MHVMVARYFRCSEAPISPHPRFSRRRRGVGVGNEQRGERGSFRAAALPGENGAVRRSNECRPYLPLSLRGGQGHVPPDSRFFLATPPHPKVLWGGTAEGTRGVRYFVFLFLLIIIIFFSPPSAQNYNAENGNGAARVLRGSPRRAGPAPSPRSRHPTLRAARISLRSPCEAEGRGCSAPFCRGAFRG